MTDDLSAAIDSAARLLVESNYVLALVGSGVSVDSGIPTFRGPGGLWTRLGEPSNRGYQEFLDNPEEWWRLQSEQQADPVRAEFGAAIEKAEPNDGHRALTELEELGVLKMTITQNVDNLHQQAGMRRLVEIHGNRTKLRCIGCELRWPRDGFVTEGHPPRCPECGDLIKGDTVMFGEPIPPGVLDVCFQELERSDCMISAGTSATVYPAAGFPETLKLRGGYVIEANTNETPLSPLCDVVLRGPTSETLPMLVRRIESLKGR